MSADETLSMLDAQVMVQHSMPHNLLGLHSHSPTTMSIRLKQQLPESAVRSQLMLQSLWMVPHWTEVLHRSAASSQQVPPVMLKLDP